MKQETRQTVPAGYGTYLIVWLVLMALLAATVVLAKLDPFHLAAVTSMSIAAIKALLVLLFFMHLKYEKGYFGFMIFIPLVILAIFISLTFSDTYLR